MKKMRINVLGIASMSKMMTEYILLDAVKHGRVKWDQEYSVSDLVYKISQKRNLSNVPLRADGNIQSENYMMRWRFILQMVQQLRLLKQSPGRKRTL